MVVHVSSPGVHVCARTPRVDRRSISDDRRNDSLTFMLAVYKDLMYCNMGLCRARLFSSSYCGSGS